MRLEGTPAELESRAEPWKPIFAGKFAIEVASGEPPKFEPAELHQIIRQLEGDPDKMAALEMQLRLVTEEVETDPDFAELGPDDQD